MAKKASTPTFVLELPLVVTKGNERIILSRLEAGRRLYNASLHEALKRLSAMRSSLEWQSARDLPKGKERNDAFKVANEHFAPSVVQPWRDVKRLQRKLDRSRRATNPNNYNANGTIKKGIRLV